MKAQETSQPESSAIWLSMSNADAAPPQETERSNKNHGKTAILSQIYLQIKQQTPETGKMESKPSAFRRHEKQ